MAATWRVAVLVFSVSRGRGHVVCVCVCERGREVTYMNRGTV